MAKFNWFPRLTLVSIIVLVLLQMTDVKRSPTIEREKINDFQASEIAVREATSIAALIVLQNRRSDCIEGDEMIKISIKNGAAKWLGSTSKNIDEIDPWGHAYHVKCSEHYVEIFSRGKDGEINTADDIKESLVWSFY